jgi:hypothetical protein
MQNFHSLAKIHKVLVTFLFNMLWFVIMTTNGVNSFGFNGFFSFIKGSNNFKYINRNQPKCNHFI